MNLFQNESEWIDVNDVEVRFYELKVKVEDEVIMLEFWLRYVKEVVGERIIIEVIYNEFISLCGY